MAAESAHHDYLAALGFQLLHEPVLVLGKQIGTEFGDARRLCDAGGRSRRSGLFCLFFRRLCDAGGRLLVVARQHDDPLEA